jgi:hypothetical protein
VVDYESKDCGQDSGTATQPNANLAGDYKISINGNSDLSSCIVGPNGAKVYSIDVSAPFNVNTANRVDMTVNGQGPSGAFSGGLELEFTDGTGDTYSLNITNSSRKDHSLFYNSDQPGILKFTWRHVFYAADEPERPDTESS